MRNKTILTLVCVLAVGVTALAGGIPPRPEQLTFPPLSFQPPDPGTMRFTLSNGIPVYARPDRQLPLVTITVLFRGGQYLEPAGKEGLADLTSEVWRTGGAGERTAQELDEELDFLAADLSTSVDDVSGSVRLNVLAKDLDAGVDILMDVLTRPRFQDDRFAKAKEDLIQRMKERNDHTASIEAREWNRLIYGDDYWMNRLPTKASVDAVTTQDCKTFVHRLIQAQNIVVAASGDFDRTALKALLDRTLGALPGGEATVPPVPQPHAEPEPGVYVVNKPDVNQGRVSLGHVAYRLGHPDEFALRVGNDILGGGGFTSWIMKRVRSDKGLAYHAGSYISFPTSYPGVFRALFQSKSRTVPGALGITLRLIEKLRTEKVGQEELTTAKNSFIQTYPRRFESAEATARLFATDELLGRDHQYWLTWREQVRKVTADQILAAARRDLHPDRMVILVVGNLADIMKGHPDYDDRLTDFGPIHRLPLRDPLTLEPLPEQ